MSLKKFIETYGIAGTVLAFAYAVQSGILSFWDSIGGIIATFSGGIQTVIEATFGQGAAVIGAGVDDVATVVPHGDGVAARPAGVSGSGRRDARRALRPRVRLESHVVETPSRSSVGLGE